MTSEVVLRRRPDGATELRVGGQFVMDDVETTSERLVAEHVLELGARDVLVGGLGLGYTARALLDGGAERVVVAELHPEVVAAVADGAGAGPFEDSRLEVAVGDVHDVVAAQPEGSFDGICLDVDNGPDQLVHEHNASLYEAEFLTLCRTRLRAGGTLCIWSATSAESLSRTLGDVFDDVTTLRVPISFVATTTEYWLLVASAAPDDDARLEHDALGSRR